LSTAKPVISKQSSFSQKASKGSTAPDAYVATSTIVNTALDDDCETNKIFLMHINQHSLKKLF
jgi:hypothetical protein